MRKMKVYLPTVLTGLILALALPVYAHHSAAALFDDSKNVEVKGTVKLWRFSNPHPLLVLEVTDPKGQKVEWDISFGNPSSNMLRKRGWSGETFKFGELVVAKGHPARDPAVGAMDSAVVTRADGKPVP